MTNSIEQESVGKPPLKRRELRDHLIKMLYMREFHEKDEIDEQNGLYRRRKDVQRDHGSLCFGR